MTRLTKSVRHGSVRHGALAILVAVLAAGCSSSSSEEAQQTTTSAADTTGRPPIGPGPTNRNVKLVIYERALSECGTYPLAELAAKYKAAKKTKRSVAQVVGRAWAQFFRGGRDAIKSGRDGCLQGFSRR